MNKKTTDIVTYITWVGLIVAIILGDMNESKFHINQAMVIWLAGLVFALIGLIPVVGGVIAGIGGLACLVLSVLGILSAVKGEEKPLPLIGGIKILK